nr:hypothetical protein [Tanacetum cinerariifolium]
MANVSKSISIPNEDFSDDTTPSVARKFLNEVKSTILTLQRVVKQRMTIKTYNWSSSTHQELHKIEAAKFVGDFKSLANEADASLAKQKALELEIERLLKAVVSQDIMIIVQNESVVDTSDLKTELERMKERFENYIIKKKTEYAKLWNDWYKKCNECKYDKFSYDKAYKDMQQKIKRLQAQLGDLKGKSKDTSSVLDTQNLLSQKLENENVKLEFQVLNYARENAHLKATYNNMFDSISVSRAQTKTIIASLQNELQSNIYKNAKLRTQLFKKVSDQKDNTQDTSKNTKFAKQPIVENLPKIDNTKTRRPQLRSNTKNDRVPSASKSSQSKNKEAEVEEHHRNSLLSKNNKHMSSAWQFYDSDLEVTFKRNACFIRNLEGVDLLKRDRSKNLYTINLHEMASASPICLMARLPMFKYHNEHLCPSWEQGKRKRASHPPKPVPNSRQRLHLLHMDLCGPMRIVSINGKRYVLVIVNDYPRYTWVHFLRSKDEAPEVIIKFLKRITVLFKSPAIIIRTDNIIEFKNQVLKEYFDTVDISHQMSSVQTPQQNGVVKRRNQTLVEAARTMLIFSQASLFLWAEAIATAICNHTTTQERKWRFGPKIPREM